MILNLPLKTTFEQKQYEIKEEKVEEEFKTPSSREYIFEEKERAEEYEEEPEEDGEEYEEEEEEWKKPKEAEKTPFQLYLEKKDELNDYYQEPKEAVPLDYKMKGIGECPISKSQKKNLPIVDVPMCLIVKDS